MSGNDDLDGCVNYFTSFTQSDVPIRQLGKYTFATNPPPLPDGTQPYNPCNTWFCNDLITEYDCMGISYTPVFGSTGNVINYISSYKTLTEWSNIWSTGACVQLFQDMIYGAGTSQGTVAFNVENFQVVQDDFKFMFSRFFNQDVNTAYVGNDPTGPSGSTGNIKYPECNLPNNGVTGTSSTQIGGKFSNLDNNCNVYIGGQYGVVPPSQNGYNAFQDILLNACQNLPGVCQYPQQYMCNRCSREEIFANPYLTTLCGCTEAAATSQSNTFYNDTMKNYSPSCDPLCNRIDTIKNVNPVTGVTEECNANVCVMTGISINSISSTGVTPTFNQVCPACANGGNCICIIDATFDSTIASVKGDDGVSLGTRAVFNQYCPNSQCFINDPETGLYNEVQCESTLPKSTSLGTASEARVKIPILVFIIFGVLLIVFIIAIFAYKYQTESIPVYLVENRYSRY